MAASFTIAARNNGFSKADVRVATRASVTAYREAMTEFAGCRHDGHLVRAHLGGGPDERDQHRGALDGGHRQEEGGEDRRRRGAEKIAEKAHTRDSLQALSKLAELRRRSATGSSASRRSSSRLADVAASSRHLAPTRSSTRSTSSSAPTGQRCKTTVATCSSGSRSSTSPARSSESAASARGRSSSCSRAATNRTRCSCRSKEATASVLGGPPPEEPLPPARRTGRARTADDAGRQRHLLGLDEGRRRTTATCTGANCAT